ncbi:class I SAM-dependent methyltransferase [Candidatus Margulisiibacteriota bacterium]
MKSLKNRTYKKKICSKDAFVRWNEDMTRIYDTEKFYNDSNFIIKHFETCRKKAIIKCLDHKKNEKILDIGCGPGEILLELRAGKSTGIDLSMSMVRRARERLRSKANILHMDAEHMAFANGSFDKIVCTETLEHVLNPYNVIKEISRILKPQGILVLTIPNEGLINAFKKSIYYLRIDGLFNKKDGYSLRQKNDWHLWEYSKADIRNMFANEYELLAVSAIPFVFMPFRYIYKLRKKC